MEIDDIQKLAELGATVTVTVPLGHTYQVPLAELIALSQLVKFAPTTKKTIKVPHRVPIKSCDFAS